MTDTTVVPSIVKTVHVPLPVEKAFTLFTDRIGEWWPFEGHSVGGQGSTVSFADQRRLVEVLADGTESTWGEVLIWDPPRGVRLTWHPGADASPRQTQVSVTFTTTQTGTLVRLEHSGWESQTLDDADIHAGYSSGWVVVLDSFTVAAR
jgi:uncharacterized protein YndB with AHSA1/START domain